MPDLSPHDVTESEILERLRELAAQPEGHPLAGRFTVRQVADGLGLTANEARDFVRDLLQQGRVEPSRVSLTDEQAWAMGWLQASSVVCYRLLPEEAG